MKKKIKLDKSQRNRCATIARKLMGAFVWEDTKEGYRYWHRVHNKLINMSIGS